MKRAYVTLVMCGETYVQGALVLARSLQASGSDADRVVMVDAEVGPEAREVLGKLFTVVREVEGVAVEVSPSVPPLHAYGSSPWPIKTPYCVHPNA